MCVCECVRVYVDGGGGDVGQGRGIETDALPLMERVCFAEAENARLSQPTCEKVERGER